MTILCALCFENRTDCGAEPLVCFCVALSGLEISGSLPRAHALGFAVPPFQGLALHHLENPEGVEQQSPGREPWEAGIER